MVWLYISAAIYRTKIHHSGDPWAWSQNVARLVPGTLLSSPLLRTDETTNVVLPPLPIGFRSSRVRHEVHALFHCVRCSCSLSLCDKCSWRMDNPSHLAELAKGFCLSSSRT